MFIKNGIIYIILLDIFNNFFINGYSFDVFVFNTRIHNFALTNFMSKLRTILSGRGKRLFILTAIMMLLVTTYRPFMVQNLSFNTDPSHYQDIPAEKESSSDHISIVSAAYEAVVPIYKIQLAVIYFAIFKLQLIEVIIENVNVDLPLPQSSYFRILFRTFISPNAP